MNRLANLGLKFVTLTLWLALKDLRLGKSGGLPGAGDVWGKL